jgi:hypothetical protein
MSKHYIYEIFGKKIGATNDVARRMKQQNVKEGEYRIIEEHTNAKVASEREIALQKEFGYPVDRIAYWKTLRWQKKGQTKESHKKRVANTNYKEARAKAVANTDYSRFTLSHWQTPEVIKKRVANTNYKKLHLKGAPKRVKIINQYDLEGNFIKQWEGATQARKSLGKTSGSDIIQCCRGKKKTAYKFIWKYA